MSFVNKSGGVSTKTGNKGVVVSARYLLTVFFAFIFDSLYLQYSKLIVVVDKLL